MNNFISVFDELSQLYEAADRRAVSKTTDQLCSVVTDDGFEVPAQMFVGTKKECEDWLSSHPDPSGKNRFKIRDCADICVLEEEIEIEVDEATADEAADEVADEATPDEAEEETEVKTLILECTECGCLVRKEETEVNIDEETDLANVDEACAQCEKTAGYKVVGELVPYDAAEPVEESVDTNEDDELSDPAFSNALMESTLTEGKIIDAVKKVATRVGADAATIVRCFAELGDIITKRDTKFYEFAEYIENKAVLKALMNGNESVLNSCTKEDIEDLAADIEEYEQDKKDGKLASADDIEEGLFDFGKKKREAERKRQEEEEAARKAAQEKEKSKSKWPTAADYDAYEKEQREQRRIDATMAQYKAMGQGWNKRDDSSTPSNTQYVGVNYSGGDYF